MAKHIAPGTSTQVAHPGKAALRTAVAYLLAAIAFLAAAVPVLQDVMGEYLPEAWAAYLTAAVAFLVALATAITRIMALAKAQDFLAKLGLGTGTEKEGPEVIAADLPPLSHDDGPDPVNYPPNDNGPRHLAK